MDILDDPVPVAQLTLPDRVKQLKYEVEKYLIYLWVLNLTTKIKINTYSYFNLQANYFFEIKDYTAAINVYNDAINILECSVLFSNRAAAYIKRKWHGDFYAALKDCVTALKLDPNHMKAHFRLAVCLYELNQLKDSKMYLDHFTMKYPSYKTSAAYKVLHDNILQAQHKKEEENNTGNYFIKNNFL